MYVLYITLNAQCCWYRTMVVYDDFCNFLELAAEDNRNIRGRQSSSRSSDNYDAAIYNQLQCMCFKFRWTAVATTAWLCGSLARTWATAPRPACEAPISSSRAETQTASATLTIAPHSPPDPRYHRISKQHSRIRLSVFPFFSSFDYLLYDKLKSVTAQHVCGGEISSTLLSWKKAATTCPGSIPFRGAVG